MTHHYLYAMHDMMRYQAQKWNKKKESKSKSYISIPKYSDIQYADSRVIVRTQKPGQQDFSPKTQLSFTISVLYQSQKSFFWYCLVQLCQHGMCTLIFTCRTHSSLQRNAIIVPGKSISMINGMELSHPKMFRQVNAIFEAIFVNYKNIFFLILKLIGKEQRKIENIAQQVKTAVIHALVMLCSVQYSSQPFLSPTIGGKQNEIGKIVC